MIISNAERLFCRRKAIVLLQVVRRCCYASDLTCVGAIGFKALLSCQVANDYRFRHLLQLIRSLLSPEGFSRQIA